jgi:hypothetical protein
MVEERAGMVILVGSALRVMSVAVERVLKSVDGWILRALVLDTETGVETAL